MNLDGARNAKAEIFTEAFGFNTIAAPFGAGSQPTFAPAPDTDAFAQIRSARRDRKRDARELIALGILNPVGHNGDPNELNVGIFVQQKRLFDHPIVRQAQRAARGEATVIFTGPVRKFVPANPARCRPLRIGASIGHVRVSAGTLGCFCRKRSSGGIGILSNNHVLANGRHSRAGDRIIQPGKADGGSRTDPGDHVAILDKFVPIRFGAGEINTVDCAFAYLHDEVEYVAATACDPSAPQNQWAVGEVEDLIERRMPVRKIGRTTGLTEGFVDAEEIDNLTVGYGSGNERLVARFDRQIAVVKPDAPFSKPGDSGSLIFTLDNRPIALLFAGSERSAGNGPGITFANPIGTVLDALDVDIYTGA